MERQKSILGRKKGRGPTAAPGDFIALGKQSKPNESEVKRPSSPQLLGKKSSSGAPSSSASAPKKPKLSVPTFATAGRQHGDPSVLSGPSGNVSQYDEIAIAAEPTDLLTAVIAADDDQNYDRCEGLLCGAVKHLRSNRSKPDQIIYLTLMYLSKSKPSLFGTEIVIEAFCGLLKRELALTFKAKGNPLVSVLACNVLMNAFGNEENWPDNFVKVFVEDSLGERVWVDREDCRTFVDNIHTAFGTKKSPKHLLMATAEALRGEPSGASSPAQMMIDDDDSSKMSDGGDGDKSNSSGIISSCLTPRYPFQQAAIETYILDTIRDILNRRQAMDSSSRNLIRLMTSTCGYGDVRNMAAQRIDMWLQNPKLTRVSQDLLLAVCTNCDKHDQTDLEVIGHLTKMRMKTKPLINHFLNCMRELLSQHPDNLRMILNHTVYNELSTSRNPNNMHLIPVMFSHSSDQAAKILAEIFQDLLTNKDDYLKALRMLLREIVRCTRLDMNFSTFCLGLMQERTEQKFIDMDPALKERFVISLADIISMDVLLSVAPNIREAAASLMQGDHKNLELIHVFKRQVAVIQRDAVWWLHTVVPKIVELKADTYLHCLKKVLFLESAEHYYNKDNWPPESERGLMLRLASEGPVMEDTLMRLLVIGLLRELPLSSPDAVELVDQLVCRAASLHYELGLMDVLQMERLEFIDALLNLCVYKHPENIQLPQGYTPPNLAITGLMWKAWLTLLIITAYNPAVFGETAWQKYPTLQFLMEMVMTNNYTFPPPTTATDDKIAEEFKARERQIREQEIQLILEFETHLAAATSKVTITKSNSLLIGQLNHNDPTGPARFPPQEIVEQLKSLNTNLKLGQMLCRSRDPDFLLRIINRQGTSQSMPWLAELVESSEGSLDVLPVQCLCEFLLHEPSDLATEDDVEDLFGADRTKRKQKNKKHQQLLYRLQELVHSTSTESKTMKEVLDYFLQRLASTQASTRHQAVKGLSSVVAPVIVPSEGDDSMDVDMKPPDSGDWLLVHMPSLPLFHEVSDSLCLALRKACQVETDPKRINSYIVFLSQHALNRPQQTWNDLALDIAQLLVERTSVVNFILPDIAASPSEKTNTQRETLAAFINLFVLYMHNARKEDKDTFSWSNTQDQIRLQWESGQSATVHVLVVHAMVVLLTYGRPMEDPKAPENQVHAELFKMWIQENNRMPSGYLLDTSEEALLLPDWLKLRMLRTSDDRLVNAALLEVEPTQLVLFVQSFGIPVPSMSRLLAMLDQAVASDSAAMSGAVQDASYMATLVEIQHERGATGGKAFYSMLKQGKDKLVVKDSSKVDEEMKTQDVWNVKGTGEVILPNSVDKLARLLDQIFSDSSAAESGPAKLFQCVLKAVSTDKIKAAAIIKALDNLLSSSKRETFAQKVYSSTFRSCPILKVLIAKQPELHSDLLPVMEKLNTLGTGQRSMLASVVNQFMASNGKPRQGKASAKQIEGLVNKCSGKRGLEPSVFLEGMKKLKDPGSMEAAVHGLMDQMMAKGRNKEGTKLACQILAGDGCVSMTTNCATLFVDWLSLLDPEIVRLNPELQEKLLFARTIACDSGSSSDKVHSVPSQAHLLALLTHQTSWDTLTQCLTRLLQQDRMKELNPTAVLDFMWACQHIPKIWQGREKRTQEVEQNEDVLGLTSSQICTVVDYIQEEAQLLATAKSPDQPVANDLHSLMKGRMDLLLSCVCDDTEKVVTVVSHLQKIYEDSSGLQSKCAVSLATSLYLQFPYIQSWLAEDSPLLSELMSSSAVQSQMDVISHRLISSLGYIKPGSKSQSRMYDANIACRKMAAHHPAIFLRQLPLIGAILSGQTQFTPGEMRHSNRYLLFTHVLGLLELLQPHVFRPDHSGLDDILESFFSLLQIHGEEKALVSQVHKLVLILQNFLTHDPQRALPMLQKQLGVLGNLSLVYPDMFELKALLTSLTLPRQSESVQTPKDGAKTSAGPELISQTSGYTATQLLPFMRRFSKESTEELLTALQDLDEMSKRKVDILAHFESQLCNLMMSPSDQCRGTAFALILRALRQNPKKAENFVATFLDCLGSENPDVVNSALRNLAEFTSLCQEEATSLLQKTFTMGIKMSIDTSSYISEALQMLNLHSTSVQ